jgi:phospholipid/cholesterol/gamma-HCH transport system substrate-binding protein
MPSQQEVKWSQLKVGVIVLVSVILLSTLLFLMTSATGLIPFETKLTAFMYLDNADGLKIGAPVSLEGVTIGEVKRIQVSTDPSRKLTPIRVEMKLSPKFHSSVRTDTVAALATVGVLGDTVVDLDSKSASGPEIAENAEIKTVATPSIQDVVKSSQGTIASVNVTLAKLNGIIGDLQAGHGSAGQLIENPALYNNANQAIAQLRDLTTSINSGHGSVGKLLHDDALYNKLNDAATNLDTVTQNLNSGKGSAGKLLHDDTLYNNLNSSLAHLNSILAEADSGKGALGLMTKDPAFAKKLNDTVTNLDTLLAGVNQGKGTLGKFATDEAAYTNLNKLLVSSNDLVTMFRTDPKKYLTIQMKVF